MMYVQDNMGILGQIMALFDLAKRKNQKEYL
jgi:hypothetical protein